MKKIKTYISKILFGAGIACVLVSCVGGEFDRPPFVAPESSLEPNITIADLKDRYDVNYAAIPDSIIIQGIVVANDISGNIYKKIFLQDSTGGIDIEINASDNYKAFPVGQKMAILLKDLAVGKYNDQPQIGADNGGAVGRIELTDDVFFTHFGKKGYPLAANVPTPKVLTIAELNAAPGNYVCSLVQINDVSFLEAGEPFADPANASGNATDRQFSDSTGSMVLRTSTYANFSTKALPQGKGTLVGILGTYRGTLQFFLRDSNDVKDFKLADSLSLQIKK